jgi:hypothetical protein
VSVFVVTVAHGGTPELFGPFPTRDKAWKYANKVRKQRLRDESMPAVAVQPVQPGRAILGRL